MWVWMSGGSEVQEKKIWATDQNKPLNNYPNFCKTAFVIVAWGNKMQRFTFVQNTLGTETPHMK